MIIKAMTIAMT